MRVKEAITNQGGSDWQTNSPHQYQRKCIEKIMENMAADLRVYRVKNSGSYILAAGRICLGALKGITTCSLIEQTNWYLPSHMNKDWQFEYKYSNFVTGTSVFLYEQETPRKI